MSSFDISSRDGRLPTKQITAIYSDGTRTPHFVDNPFEVPGAKYLDSDGIETSSVGSPLHTPSESDPSGTDRASESFSSRDSSRSTYSRKNMAEARRHVSSLEDNGVSNKNYTRYASAAAGSGNLREYRTWKTLTKYSDKCSRDNFAKLSAIADRSRNPEVHALYARGAQELQRNAETLERVRDLRGMAFANAKFADRARYRLRSAKNALASAAVQTIKVIARAFRPR